MNHQDIAAFISDAVRGYVRCAVWADLYRQATPDDVKNGAAEQVGDMVNVEHPGGPFEDVGDAYPARVDSFPWVEAHARVSAFLTGNGGRHGAMWGIVRATGMTGEQCGHDLWMTSKGHGAGFGDRGYGITGTKLADGAKSYGSGGMAFVMPDGSIVLDI